jgi:hypothetical protein
LKPSIGSTANAANPPAPCNILRRVNIEPAIAAGLSPRFFFTLSSSAIF